MKNILVGFLVGVLCVVGVAWQLAPSMMLKEHASPLSVDETVAKISSNALALGWVVAGVKPLHKSVAKHGGGNLPPVMLVNLCQANHAYNILKDDENKIVSVMMPCTISVYQKSDGKTYVGVMNAGLLGTLFGGNVATVMGGEVAEQQQKFIEFLL
ncbi:conserved hypothetical protein [Magnetococcus marinus MC-1]|uniref:DUF302 domain-containing protein n=1 Tax=Magnetococcus marinus (strain ATCC BAA-1437 / JCM 17883 / MC-1) TaxID=156889 RepID=A0L5Q0_MAGMM|nr:DUF302 domain-containing protein [Magnetococcus marinus]ABK43293.1 conserved hypothetical protein [Magnetococcus marinus MC-1]